MKYLRKERSTIPALHLGGKYEDNEFDKANMLNNYSTHHCHLGLDPMRLENPCIELREGTHESLLCTEECVMDLLQNIDV